MLLNWEIMGERITGGGNSQDQPPLPPGAAPADELREESSAIRAQRSARGKGAERGKSAGQQVTHEDGNANQVRDECNRGFAPRAAAKGPFLFLLILIFRASREEDEEDEEESPTADSL